ncbi:hypothetical protein WDU94_013973 [Cyamophila willieti]
MKQKYKQGKYWIIGDYNSSVGTRRKEDKKIMGEFGIDRRNKRGERMVNFANEVNLNIVNTYQAGTKEEKWTWKSPKNTLHEIDFLLCNEIDNVLKTEVLYNLEFHSDHRMVQSYVNTKKQRKFVKIKEKVLKIKNSQKSFKKHLNEKLNEEFKTKNLGIQTMYDKIINTITWAVKQENKEQGPTQRIKSKKLTENTKELIVKREELNKKRNKTIEEQIEHTEIRKLVKREIRNDIHNYEENIIKQIMETTKSTKKITKELSQTSKCWIQKLEGSNKKMIYDRNEIVEEATKFYEELYNDPEKDQATSQTDENQSWDNFEFEKSKHGVLKEEVEAVIKDLKRNKAPGIDNITNELIIVAKEELEDLIAILFTEVLHQRKIPKQWEKRIKTKMLENQPSEQAGFIPSFSTIDHIHSVNQIIEKGHEYNIPLYMAFCDYSKAFDSIKHCYIWESLKTFGIDQVYIEVLKEIYRNTRAFISLDKNGREFEIRRGVRQGCPISSDLFNTVLETIFRDLNWENNGLPIDGKKITNLRFADDVVIIANNSDDMEKMINELRIESCKRGLEMNINKTKVMTNSEKAKIMLGQEELKYEDTYIYLGHTISMKTHLDEEINRRINLAWGKFWSLKKILKGNLPAKTKGQILESCIFPTLIYGCQAWAMKQSHEKKLASSQNKMMRSILNVKISQKINTKKLEKQLNVKRAEIIARNLKIKWAGHMMRTQDNRWSKTITEWIPRDRKRNRGRQRKRWKDELVEKAGPLWMRRSQDREYWKSLSTPQ